MQLESIDQFVFDLPLYVAADFSNNYRLKVQLLRYTDSTLEGFCIKCGKERSFKIDRRRSVTGPGPTNLASLVKDMIENDESINVVCLHNKEHVIRIIYDVSGKSVTKIGRSPSLADIGGRELKPYRGKIDKIDGEELHRAIGLASVNVGVGSFAYLRRVFERLIWKRFEEFHEKERWDREEFRKSRMDDKISMIRSHIPDFLFENRAIYGILSKGIHELSEEECLEAFPVLKQTIFFILDDDFRKQEEIRQRDHLSKQLKSFSNKHTRALEPPRANRADNSSTSAAQLRGSGE